MKCSISYFGLNKGGDMPLVSVIMPTFNRGVEIRTALESLCRQTCTDFEHSVVNDGGEPVDSIIDEFRDRLSIIYTNADQNRGASAARNAAVLQSSGKYICFLDDDDFLFPEHLETLVSELEKGEYQVVYSDAYRQMMILQPDGTYRAGSKDLFFEQDFNRDYLFIASDITSASIMFHRVCLEKTGLFDTTLTTHEDLDLWIRLAVHWDFLRIRKVTAQCVERDAGNSLTINNNGQRLKNMETLYRRYADLTSAKVQYLQFRTLYKMYVQYGLAIPSFLQVVIEPHERGYAGTESKGDVR